MKILTASAVDLEEILAIQKTSYLSEAEIYNNYNLQPLTQTADEIIKEFENGVVLKAVSEDGKITGSVRGYVKNNTLYIGKLMVYPEFQNQGIGKALLMEIENRFQGMRYELFTGSKSLKNIAIYLKSGYREFKRAEIPDGTELIYFEKNAGKRI